MNYQIDRETYEEIAEMIQSDDSPVGIDAKKTHILIIKMLSDFNQRLSALETKIDQLQSSSK